jgi:hypothetical protein
VPYYQSSAAPAAAPATSSQPSSIAQAAMIGSNNPSTTMSYMIPQVKQQFIDEHLPGTVSDEDFSPLK